MPNQNRVALVIGNTDYALGALKNPVRDAALITSRLKRLGYDIVGGTSSDACKTGHNDGANPPWQKTFDLVQQFVAKIEPGSAAVIYYAGHALQVGDQNYLMPVDTDLSPNKPDLGLVKIKPVIEQAAGRAGGEGTVVAFLDACRDNPLDTEQMRIILGMFAEAQPVEHGQRGPVATTRGGLATVKMDPHANRARTFIGFASAPGDVAFDGKSTNPNSPFAQALDRHLATRGLEIEEFYNRVGKDVLEQVRSELDRYQDPWSETNCNTRVFLHPSNGWPVFWLALAGLVAGAIISYAVFDKGEIINQVPAWKWGLGALFGLVAAAGTLLWGSKRVIDAVFAFLGPTVGFALALALLQIIPPFQPGRPPDKPGANLDLARTIYWYVAIAGGSLFYIGTALLWRRNLPDWPRRPLQWVNRAVSLLLPLIAVVVLLQLQYYLSHPELSPSIIAIAMFAVLSGVIYATSTTFALRAQRGLFSQFGPFTGAISVGLLMAGIFALYVAVTGVGPRGMPKDQANSLLIAFGALWHGLLGAQLGYCFAYYVPDYRTWSA